MNSFVYDIPVKVYFGENQLSHLGEELSRYGKRVLLTYGGGSIKKTGLYDAVVSEIKKAGLEFYELSGIAPNPRIESVREGVEICKRENIDVLLAVGGGSTLDATKWMAAGACVEHDPWEFFSQWAPVEKALPVLTVPTLAATGSEMDAGGVISNPETQDKIGRVAKPLLPKVSFLDPTNTYTVSPYQTACGAADMMSHIMEVYFNMETDLYMLDCFMEGLMKTVIKYTPIALREPENYEARANLMWASSHAINGLISLGKDHPWSVHSMEHQLSAYYDITHGVGLAILTPAWMDAILSDKTVDKFVDFAVNVWGVTPKADKFETAKEGIAALRAYFKELGIPQTLPEVGIKDETHFDVMAEKAEQGGLLKAYVPLPAAKIKEIYRACMG